MGNDVIVFVGEFDIALFYFVAQMFGDARNEADVVNSHNEFKVGEGFLEVEEHRIECMVDEDDIVRVCIIIFQILHFFVCITDDVGVVGLDISDKISSFHQVG